MWNAPTPETMNQLPRIYQTEGIPLQDKTVHMHLYLGAADWFIVEADESGELLFGFACLGDISSAEWGYISLPELKAINIQGIEVDNDLYWRKRPAREVDLISRAMGWQEVEYA